MTRNPFKANQIVRNHRAKIRWGSEVKMGSKLSVTGEVAIYLSLYGSDGWVGPAQSYPQARLPRSSIPDEETA